MTYTVRPISDRTWLGTMGKRPTQFKAKWPVTEALLLDEVAHLKGRDLVIEVDITEGDLKLNGELRTTAKPSSPAVVVAFDSRHGPMMYRCDRFYTTYYDQGQDWQHNARAIALTLQALRAVDRYGATETGQQYTGFKALPAGRSMPSSHLTTDQARDIIIRAARGLELAATDDPAVFVHFRKLMLEDSSQARYELRRAQRLTHPDRHDGDRTMWDQVEAAATTLGMLS